MKQSRSFTLIELLVVISIIGLLSSIVLVSMKGTREKARIAKGLEFSQSINNALGADAVGIWRFEEGVGSTVYDYSGYGNNGTINGGANYTTGILGKALSFDGVNDYVNAGNGASLNITDAITVEAWVETNLLSDYGIIATKGSYTYFFSLNSSEAPALLIGNSSASSWNITCSGSSLQTGTWYHIAGQYSSSVGSVSLYINGVLNKTCSGTAQKIGSNTSWVSIGSASSYSSTYFFKGFIDEVRIYSQALSAMEIQQHYVEGLERHKDMVIK